MRLSLLSLLSGLSLVGACAPSQATIDRDNLVAKDRASKDLTANVTAFTPTSVSIIDLSVPEAPRGRDAVPAHASRPANPGALLGQEHVAALDDGRMVFVGAYCVVSEPCSDECREYASYTYGRAPDGHVIITRTYPRYTAVKTIDDSSCAGMCGGIPHASRAYGPDAATPAMLLGTLVPGQIEIRDNGYHVEFVQRRCTNMTPVP